MINGDNLKFSPNPIISENLRLGSGTSHQTPIGLIQKIAALRAYSNFSSLKDWMEKLSSSYVVAITTRSADELLMKVIQAHLECTMSFSCKNCKQATIGTSIIRERLFPKLKDLREHANKLVHHLDSPSQKGITDLNIEGVFDYCHHLFQENNEALFGKIPDPTGKFPSKKCKSCRATEQSLSV